MTPIHTHDCDRCILLGTGQGRDIYVHIDPSREDMSTLIIRHSSDPSDYDSCKLFYIRRDIADRGRLWLYALGLYDGYQRALHDGLVQRGIDVAAAIINEGDGND